MKVSTRFRLVGVLGISLLMIGAPSALANGIAHPIPDAQIRPGSGTFIGDDIINADAAGQTVENSGVIGQKLTFFILIENDGADAAANGFKVKRSGAFRAGYRVRFYNAANKDVTGKVTRGTFRTPSLAPGADYLMRATVKVRPQATVGSNVTRLVTVSDPADPSVKDAVRFTATRPGPAVRFSVSGLVPQPSVCVVGPECANFPSADYPRQIAKITALDALGNVATGYAGTVSFEHPLTHNTPSGLPNLTLTNGVGYVPVLVPDLSLGFFEEPFTSNCPSNPSVGNGVVLTATDTLDPSIYGCQNIPGGDLTIIFANGFDETTTTLCPSGCFDDPTDSIVVDPTFINSSIITPNITSNASILIGTSTDYVAIVPVNISQIYVRGSDISDDTLSTCTGCSDSNNFLVSNGIISFKPNGELTVTDQNITFDATYAPVNNAEFNMFIDSDSVPVNTIVTGGSTPTCYQNIQLVDSVSLSECGNDPIL